MTKTKIKTKKSKKDPYPNMSPAAVERLMVAVLRIAVEDYRAFERRGLIVSGDMPWPSRWDHFIGREECRNLIRFFREGGGVDQLIAITQLRVGGDAIRERLGMITPAD